MIPSRPTICRRAGVLLGVLVVVVGCRPPATPQAPGTNPVSAPLVFSLGTAPLPQAGSSLAATEQLLASQSLLSRGKTNDAVKLLEQIVKEYPEFEEAHFSRGFVLAQLGQNAEAIKCYEAALGLVPDYAEAHNNLGNLLVKEGRFEPAIPHFEAAIDKSPDNANYYNNLGTAFARLGRAGEAIPQFNRAVQINAEYPDAWYNLGRSYAQTGRLAEAQAPLRMALKLRPDLAPARKLLMEVEQRLARPNP